MDCFGLRPHNDDKEVDCLNIVANVRKDGRRGIVIAKHFEKCCGNLKKNISFHSLAMTRKLEKG